MQFKQYLVGDSHATDFYAANSNLFPEIEWKTILSPGIQRLVRQNARHTIGEDQVVMINGIFKSLAKNSRIFLSCTDIDARQGAIGFEKFLEEDYFKFFTNLIDTIQSKDIIVLDWYSIRPHDVDELNGTVINRVKLRTQILSILDKLKKNNLIKDYHSTFMHPDLDDENGQCKDTSVFRDNIHYDFKHEKIINILNPVLKKFVEESR